MGALVLDADLHSAIEYLTAELNKIERNRAVRKGLIDAAKILGSLRYFLFRYTQRTDHRDRIHLLLHTDK